MRTKTLGLIVSLSLSIMLSIPSYYILNVQAVEQASSTTRWSAYGPRQQNIIFTLYTSSASALADFDAGLLDVFESPLPVNRISGDIANPDYYVTKPVNDFGIFEQDINHQVSWLGKAMQVSRSTVGSSVTPSFAPATPTVTGLSTTATGACPAGQFKLALHLKNNEEGGATILDAGELVTATPPAGTGGSAADAGDGSVDGTYVLPCLSNVPPNYVIGTNVYGTSTGTAAAVTVLSSACPSTDRCDADFNVNYRSQTTKKATWASVYIARAISHLVDKPNFRNLDVLQGLADCLDVQAPAAQNLMNSVGAGACTPVNHQSAVDIATMNAECADLQSVDPGIPCSPVSLYNLSSDSIGGAGSCGAGTIGVSCFLTMGVQSGGVVPNVGYSGTLDLRAACDFLVLAGFPIIGSGGCAGVAADPQTAHLDNGGLQLGVYIRSPGAFPPRTRYGQIIADGLNWLFGTPAPIGGTVCYGTLGSCNTGTIRYYTIGEVTNIVFAGTTGWTMYTGGFTLGSTPDHLFSLYHSRFASDLCAGVRSNFPNNYPIFCDPLFDTQVRAAQFAGSLSEAYSFFQKAGTLGATRGMTVAQYSQVNRFLSLNAWNTEPTGTPTASSLVNQLGHGFQSGSSYYALLNMRPSGIAPSNPAFQAGGGTPGLIRRPSSNGPIIHLNPFTAQTVWEFDPLVMMYDSLLGGNPNTGGSSLQLYEFLSKSHTSNFDATTGKTTQVWNLRSDICWQDSTVGPVGQPCNRPVTSQDVCFSILTQRDVPSGNAQPSVADVDTCSAPDNQTAVVVLNGRSPFFETNIGGIFQLPSHVWGAACGWPTGPYDSAHEPVASVRGADCGKESFDSMALGMMVGSSAYSCKIPSGFPGAGTVGGSCATSSTGALIGQNIGVGGHILLQRSDSFARCCDETQNSNLQALSWSDFNKDGKVTLVDAANLAAVFGFNDAYFDHPLYGNSPGIVDIGEGAFLSAYFDSGIIAPCNGLVCASGPLVAADPRIDPYLLGSTASGGYYQNTFKPSPTQVQAQLAGSAPGTTAELRDQSGTLIGTATADTATVPGKTLYTFSSTIAAGSIRFSGFGVTLEVTWG